jgi:hypothetical protein
MNKIEDKTLPGEEESREEEAFAEITKNLSSPCLPITR